MLASHSFVKLCSSFDALLSYGLILTFPTSIAHAAYVVDVSTSTQLDLDSLEAICLPLLDGSGVLLLSKTQSSIHFGISFIKYQQCINKNEEPLRRSNL
jgi:hypothetical protein